MDTKTFSSVWTCARARTRGDYTAGFRKVRASQGAAPGQARYAGDRLRLTVRLAGNRYGAAAARQPRRKSPSNRWKIAGRQKSKSRLHALCTLDGLTALRPETISATLREAHPAVREHAVRLSEILAGHAPGLFESLVAG